jgi:ribosomal protein L40E
VIEAAAFFGVKVFKGATRRHNNKLRKTLSGYGQEVPPIRPSNRPAPKAVPIPYSLRERKICPRCNKLAKHRATECRSSRSSANKASISKEIKSSKDLNNASRKVTTAIFSTITDGEDASDEEWPYLCKYG